MQNSDFYIGQTVGIHKPVKAFSDLTIYGEISAIRRHWSGNPDLMEIQVGGLELWISLDPDVQILPYTPKERGENDCN